MVRKKNSKSRPATRQVVDRSPRKEPYNGEKLMDVVARLRNQASRLKSLARDVEEAQLDNEVVIDGHAMLQRGLNQVDNFVDNAARAIREAKTSQDHS